MKKTLFGFLFLISSVSSAQSARNIFNYDYWAYKNVEDYLSQVDYSSSAAAAVSCQPAYGQIVSKGVLDFRYALGYFDDSTGVERTYEGMNYGISPSLDVAIFFVVKRVLTEPCIGSRKACGFREIGGDANNGRSILEKTVNILGKSVRARITMTHASASESYILNTTQLRERQNFLSAQAEQNFFGGLQKADIVFYNGHSRNGGGPDFRPPVLDSHSHPDYNGYYLVRKEGLKGILRSVPANPNSKVVLGLFSCNSQMKFAETLKSQLPNLGLILSVAPITYFDTLTASMGYLEGILQGRCGDQLSQTSRQGSSVQNGFRDFRLNR